MKQNLLFQKILAHSKQTFIAVFCFVANVVFAQNPLLLSNPFPGSGGRSIQKIVSTQAGKTFYNTVDNNNHFSKLWGLWVTDGTPTGTVKLSLTSPGFASTEATMLTPLGNNKIVFAGDNENGYGEVWVSDGTQARTMALENFNPGSFGFSNEPVMGIASLGNLVLYGVFNSDHHLQIRKTDGTPGGTGLVYDFGIKQKSYFTVFNSINNVIYFDLFDIDNGGNDQVWRSDGTTSGTYLLKDLARDYALIGYFMQAGNSVYFNTQGISTPKSATLFKTDGTVSGTAPFKTITGVNSYLLNPPFASIDNILYFFFDDNVHGNELWKTDGTSEGTVLAADINEGGNGSKSSFLTALNGQLYFDADDGIHGKELWKYDGTTASLVKDIFPGSTGSYPMYITAQNNTLLFGASQSDSIGYEFWMSDGTALNTFEIANINPAINGSSVPSLITVSGNSAYFSAWYDADGDGINDPCIYKYTAPQKIWTGSVSSDPSIADNWFPSGTPSQTSSDNVIIPVSPKNNLLKPNLFVHDFYNNGGTVDLAGGACLISGDFFNAGTINNPGDGNDFFPGVFGIVRSGSTHLVGNSGTYIGQLTLSSSCNLQLTTNTYFPTLRVEGPDSIYLGDYSFKVDKYVLFAAKPTIITNGAGKLFMPVSGSPVTFNLTNPVTITNNGTPDYFGVSVSNAVLKDGFNGDTVKTQVVNKTWDIVKQTGGPANVNITLQWNAADELPGFVRNNVYLNHYTNGAWDNGTPGVASGSGPFTFSRTGITSFSPFTVSSSASALPVNLVSFTANKINNAVQLNWQTVSEKNFSFFGVERSKDGIIFSQIGEVPLSFTNSATKNYSYTDGSPITGTNFYRLKMMDADGKFTYSKIVAIRFDGNGNALQIFPNPAKDILHVQVTGSNENAALQVIDLSGRKIKEQRININGTTSVSIDINDLPRGMYNLLLKTNSKTEHQKFVKE